MNGQAGRAECVQRRSPPRVTHQALGLLTRRFGHRLELPSETCGTNRSNCSASRGNRETGKLQHTSWALDRRARSAVFERFIETTSWRAGEQRPGFHIYQYGTYETTPSSADSA